jgi:hypothetical protein
MTWRASGDLIRAISVFALLGVAGYSVYTDHPILAAALAFGALILILRGD